MGLHEKPKPEWLKVKLPGHGEFAQVKTILRDLRLATVCEGARCPNLGECWSKKSATIMIMGKICTRHCRFCAVPAGDPGGHLEIDEPARVTRAVRELDLKYVVITSVDRDDVPDGGAGHYARTILAIKELCPEVKVEALIPDFGGNLENLSIVANSKPFVLGHNLETVARLTPLVRDPRAGYQKSLAVLRRAKEPTRHLLTKSGIMVGLGETETEIIQTMQDLRDAGVDIFTIGQYLQPTRKNLPVVDFIPPDKFEWYESRARELGFRFVTSGPLVRSSYHAWQVAENL